MKIIPLTQGQFTIVDDKDYETLSQFFWQVDARGYAVRSEYLGQENGKEISKRVFMHRVVNETPHDMETDHINGLKLDNRSENLRSCTRSENQRNVSKPRRKNSTSQFKGVSLHKASGLWRARVRTGGKETMLGYFNTESEAAEAYDLEVNQRHGQFARGNAKRQGAPNAFL